MAEGAGISPHTLRDWRKGDAKFAKKFDHAREVAAEAADLKSGIASRQPKPKDWKQKFLGLVERKTDRVEALEELERQGHLNLTALDIEACCTPSSGKYDERFAKALEELELRRIWRAEDQMQIRAESRNAEARFLLQTRMKKKYGKSPGVVIDQSKTLNVNQKNTWMSAKGIEGARDWVDSVKELVGAPEPPLEIEAEVVSARDG